ncbi:MAG: hypothetical protein WCK65_00645 [Rhodospirillaceae bacterium]
MNGHIWLGLAGLVMLVGCATPVRTAGDPSPAAVGRAACERACSRDYDVCADGAGAGRGGASFFGAGAACRRQVSSCVDHCKVIVAADPKLKVSDKSPDNAVDRP